jgi:hypothetical protein
VTLSKSRLRLHHGIDEIARMFRELQMPLTFPEGVPHGATLS